MYIYGMLFFIATPLFGMELNTNLLPDNLVRRAELTAEEKEKRKEFFSKLGGKPASIEGLKRALNSKDRSPDQEMYVKRIIAYFDNLDPKSSWQLFGGSRFTREVPLENYQTLYMDSEKEILGELVLCMGDKALFRNSLVGGSGYFFGEGFGDNINFLAPYPSKIDFNPRTPPAVSPDKKLIAARGNIAGLYLFSVNDLCDGLPLKPVKGTENWMPHSFDYAFISDSEILLYDGNSLRKASVDAISQKGTDAFSTILELEEKDQGLSVIHSKILHVFAGGALLAFYNPLSSVLKKKGIRIYNLTEGSPKPEKALMLEKHKSVLDLKTSFDALSCVILYLQDFTEIALFNNQLQVSRKTTNMQADFCDYSPDSAGILLAKKGVPGVAILISNGGTFETKFFPLDLGGSFFSIWHDSGIYFYRIRLQKYCVISPDLVRTLIDRHKKKMKK